MRSLAILACITLVERVTSQQIWDIVSDIIWVDRMLSKYCTIRL